MGRGRLGGDLEEGSGSESGSALLLWPSVLTRRTDPSGPADLKATASAADPSYIGPQQKYV